MSASIYFMGVHPLVQPILDEARLAPALDVHALTPTALRALVDSRVMESPIPDVSIPSVRHVMAQCDSREVPLRIYYPADTGNLPFSLYFHGGGFMLGNIETHDKLCRYLAHRSGVAIASVDFRLCPEHAFPAAHDDCLAATLWLLQHSDEFGLDASRFAVAGESSGGHLALATTLELRNRGHDVPRVQVLLYPLVDLRTESPSFETFGSGYLLTKDRMNFYMSSYLRGANPDHPRLALLKSPALRHCPPTYLMTASLDPTLSHALSLADCLKREGALVAHDHFVGWPHGFLFWGHEEGALLALNQASAALATGLR